MNQSIHSRLVSCAPADACGSAYSSAPRAPQRCESQSHDIHLSIERGSAFKWRKTRARHGAGQSVARQSVACQSGAGLWTVLSIGALAGSLMACGSYAEVTSEQAESLKPLMMRVDQDRLMARVAALVETHDTDTPLDCNAWEHTYEPDCHLTHLKARTYIQDELTAIGYEVKEDIYEDDAWPSVNLIAEHEGSKYPDEVIIVGAHYDAFYSGADDNSTGVAAMLELATLFKDVATERTIRFMAFDLEEFGLVGSERYIKYVAESDNIVGGVVMDCIGYYDTAPGTQSGLPGFPSPDAADFLAIFGDGDSANITSQTVSINDHLQILRLLAVVAPQQGDSPLTGDLLRSDHSPFWLRGKPVLFFSDTANFRNANYHTETDTIETISPEFFSAAVKLATVSVAFQAGGIAP